MTAIRSRTRSSLAFMAAVVTFTPSVFPAEFQSDWPEGVERIWIGPEYYSNRLEDWRLREGRLECVETSPDKPMRTVQLLTHAFTDTPGSFVATVRTGPIDSDGRPHANTWTGFLIGVGNESIDYRVRALCHHWPSKDGGLIAAIDGTGRLLFRDNSQFFKGKADDPTEPWPLLKSRLAETGGALPADIELRLEARPEGATYTITLTAKDQATQKHLGSATLQGVDPEQVSGNIALISHTSPKPGGLGYWFRDWRVAGDKLQSFPDRTFGPIMAVQYTLSRNILKMTAQMGPLGSNDSRQAELQIQRNGEWQTIAIGTLVEHSFTIPFRVENWNETEDTPYRITYDLVTGTGQTRLYIFEGMIRKPPDDRDEFVVAAFTGHHICSYLDLQWNGDHFWYPHNEVVKAIRYHNPDLLYFSGDQIYEGGFEGVLRDPPDRACVDYLYHWYRWCWAFRDIVRDRPTICTPDDHDVYHGNIWGAGGVQAPPDKKYLYQSDRGGYMMDPLFVNAVHNTQTSHLPDPVDPEPLANGISVYFTRLEYARMSFAVIADRMWKSSPTVVLPEAQVVNGWIQNKAFDPVTQADVPGAELLGERQLKFLNDWSVDWTDRAYFKVLLSPTLFANVATIPQKANGDGVIPTLRYAKPGEYIEGDKPAADCDSNGWPQTGRNKAVQAIRKGFAFHICGDQHLAGFSQYGVEDWNDSSYAMCVPSIANLWPRRWYPPEPGKNRKPGSPPYTGEFLDGFGNRITVHAVANPRESGVEPRPLYDRSPGYGILRFNRRTREIVTECWPRWVDPSRPGAAQYTGWPVTIGQFDNFTRTARYTLPVVDVTGISDPVISVAKASDGEILYAVRIQGTSFAPRVFQMGEYTLTIGEPGTDKMKTFSGLTASSTSSGETVSVAF